LAGLKAREAAAETLRRLAQQYGLMIAINACWAERPIDEPRRPHDH
jgi:hypothetical protein